MGDTLNIEVDDSIQELFDFLYKTLPNKCNWNGNHINFPDMKISIKSPYKRLHVNRHVHGWEDKTIQYIETQIHTFWKQYNAKNGRIQTQILQQQQQQPSMINEPMSPNNA